MRLQKRIGLVANSLKMGNFGNGPKRSGPLHVQSYLLKKRWLQITLCYSQMIILWSKFFLAALSTSWSFVGPSVCRSVTFLKMWPLEYQMGTKTYLPAYLWDNSDSSDRRDIKIVVPFFFFFKNVKKKRNYNVTKT